MLTKVIIDHKKLKYFMTIKKFTKYQVYQIKLLLKFNFIIFCTIGKNNVNTNAFTQYLNNTLANNYNN